MKICSLQETTAQEVGLAELEDFLDFNLCLKDSQGSLGPKDLEQVVATKRKKRRTEFVIIY